MRWVYSFDDIRCAYRQWLHVCQVNMHERQFCQLHQPTMPKIGEGRAILNSLETNIEVLIELGTRLFISWLLEAAGLEDLVGGESLDWPINSLQLDYISWVQRKEEEKHKALLNAGYGTVIWYLRSTAIQWPKPMFREQRRWQEDLGMFKDCTGFLKQLTVRIICVFSTECCISESYPEHCVYERCGSERCVSERCVPKHCISEHCVSQYWSTNTAWWLRAFKWWYMGASRWAFQHWITRL